MEDLARLLLVLHDADEPFTSLRARIRVWRHRERAHAAFVAEARRAGATLFGASRGGPPPAAEVVEVVSLWRVEPDRVRVSHDGGDRDGSYGVRVGKRWWSFDPPVGAMTNADDTSIGGGTGSEFESLLAPAPLLGMLRFAPVGRSIRAGRDVIVTDAWPRPAWSNGGSRGFPMHELGHGADRYRLEVDAERGVVLAARAFAEGEAFQETETLEVEFDAALDEELFAFVAPEGEEIREAGHRDRVLLRHASIAEAQAAASFAVLVPKRVPSSWTVHCTYSGPSVRPPAPPAVSIHYRSDSGHEGVTLVLQPTGEAHHPHDTTNWERAQAGPYTVCVNGRGELSPQSQLHLDHDGTSVLMISDTLSRDQLVALAATLVPAPPPTQL